MSILKSLTRKRAILSVCKVSVHKGCGNGSMIVFTPDRKGKIVNDKNCIEQVKQIMASTPGFDIVYDRGAHVLDVDVNVGVVNNERQQSEHNSQMDTLSLNLPLSELMI